jgi:hypothetical protein
MRALQSTPYSAAASIVTDLNRNRFAGIIYRGKAVSQAIIESHYRKPSRSGGYAGTASMTLL